MRLVTLIIIAAIIVGGVLYAKKAGWLDKAAQQAQEAGDSFTAHRSKGGKHFLAMEYDEAIEEYQAAIDKEPNHPDVPEVMMRIARSHEQLSKKGNKEEELKNAMDCYKALLEKYPDHSSVAQAKKNMEVIEVTGSAK